MDCPQSPLTGRLLSAVWPSSRFVLSALSQPAIDLSLVQQHHFTSGPGQILGVSDAMGRDMQRLVLSSRPTRSASCEMTDKPYAQVSSSRSQPCSFLE